MYPSSMAARTSWLKTAPWSSMYAVLSSSLSRRTTSRAFSSPSWSRNTATCSFIVCPSSSLIAEMRRPAPAAAAVAGDDRVDPALLVVQARLGNRYAGHGRRLLGRVLAGPAPEDQRVEQR